MAVHTVVKPEKIVMTGVGMLEQEMGLGSLFQRKNFDEFKGAKDDAVNYRVEGFLPSHEYLFRGDRDVANTGAEPHEGKIKFDTYSERTIQVKLSGVGYSAVHLTDEQKDFDQITVGNLMRVQSKAVARTINRGVVRSLENAPYEVTVGDAQRDLLRSITEARRVLNRFHVPAENRLLVVGSDFETALLEDPRITLAQNAGDGRADSAIGAAILGSLRNFQVVLDQNIDPGSAYATTRDGFVLANAAPSVPNSVPLGSTASFEGYSLRWLQDYDMEARRDRSLVETYYGFRPIEDILVTYDDAAKTEVATEAEYFVRGVKMSLEGASDYPLATDELALATGVDETNSWAAYVEPA